jgi:hypothetical protein
MAAPQPTAPGPHQTGGGGERPERHHGGQDGEQDQAAEPDAVVQVAGAERGQRVDAHRGGVDDGDQRRRDDVVDLQVVGEHPEGGVAAYRQGGEGRVQPEPA